MENTWIDVLAPVLTNLGVGAIFLYLYVQERKVSRETNEQRQKTSKEITERMLNAFLEHTKVLQSFKHVLADHTKTLERVCDRLDNPRDRS